MGEPLIKRRQLIAKRVLPRLGDPIRYSPVLEGSLQGLIRSVKAQGLEGLVAKRRDSAYEPGPRSGYTPSPKNFDALIIGHYEGDKLLYAACARNGFTPALRAEPFKRLKPLEIKECPFANLPEKKAGRWGAGLTAAKMAECRWLKPEIVGQFGFVEWTPDNHLRHTGFVGLREDKQARGCPAGVTGFGWREQ